MHIVHWTDNFLPLIGGAETFVSDLAREQIASGHRVTVVTSCMKGCPAEETIAGVSVIRRPYRNDTFAREPLKFGALIRSCADIRRRLQPDLLHVHFTQISAWFELLSRPADSCPVVITLHSPLHAAATPHALTHRILSEAQALVAVSADIRTAIASNFFSDKTVSLDLILNGVAVPPLPPAPIRDDHPVIVGVGRVVVEKGFDVVLRALPLLPGVRFILAGDGPARASLEALAKSLGVADRVEFRGWSHPDDIPALINEGCLVVMPSRWREPFGLVAVQAGLMGRPLVASNIGGLPEIVITGKTGLLVPVDDEHALAGAVRDLLADPAALRRLGATARRHVLEKFTMARCADDYARIYDRVTARPLQPAGDPA